MSLKSNLVFKTTVMLGYIYLHRRYFLKSMKDSRALIHLLHDKSNSQSPKAKIDMELHFPPKALETLWSVVATRYGEVVYQTRRSGMAHRLNPLGVAPMYSTRRNAFNSNVAPCEIMLKSK